MIVYRIIREKFKNDALSAEGSRLYGGRWNPKGIGLLYTTSAAALALVEVMAHAPNVRFENLPTYWIFKIEIPDNIRSYEAAEMPPYWKDSSYEQTQTWLRKWLEKPDTLGLALPSVIVPFSQNILLHAQHPLCADCQIIDQQPLHLDSRLWRK